MLPGQPNDRILLRVSGKDNDEPQTDMVNSCVVCRKDLLVAGEKDEDHFVADYVNLRTEPDIGDHYPVLAEFLFK